MPASRITNFRISVTLNKGLTNGLISKLKVMKTFKISSVCHIKIGSSLKRRASLKIHSTVF